MKKIVLIHGDVTFYEADSIPENAKKVNAGKGFVIEKGEGVNTHTLESNSDVYIADGVMYIKETSEKIRVGHIEHGLQEARTDTGIIYRDIEQDFDYEEMEARQIVD